MAVPINVLLNVAFHHNEQNQQLSS